MPDERKIGGVVDPVIQPFVDFWSAYAKQADDVAREFLGGIENGSEFKSWQRKWSDAVSKSLDAYMRTPAFLEAMKHKTDLAVKLKRQADDFAAEFARNANIPTTNDISGLFERLHSIEEVILSRLGRIEQRLDAIEQQVGIPETAAN
jgi:hypothetical protein